ncbi:hypothetical protein HRR83_005281 [Exophiala dermatitidis]|uniref:Uncharacterized protein n=2 Tax=Exophiala dermatitidis TaxID=5970 RepID=H6C1S8_EXODN|nr:uncharacterized protein HMPREF1120_05831 [Exophiala dermatitidis NIH/UT8656]KAJ4512940.1 hypothetical protein HRR75_004707 [Exophiala dermatitidis]EHY57807.1 hypothetical protein HMPREF1120_05831 [Exophiala dermatitidis NIH/UT8656]KAJ4515976.1 hypothetical protein HRR74_005133 [Exophiala dermatitidis]KAJ4518618.1 hypothetical protein HRR73_004199 [Exophiala dermatitidis]KAJ4534129.1 hypothetical protein HRR76_006065 [Exophiala dermatitidis]
MNLFTIQQNPSKFSWTSSEATTRTPSHSWKSSSTTRHSPASTSGTEYNSPKSSHSVTGSPKHDRPEGSSSAVLSRTQSSSKLSWSLLKTKLSDSKRTLTGVGVDRKQHPSSSKSAYPSPTKTRLKVSPPIPIIPERPEPLLLDHPLLDFSETETGQSHNDTSKKNIVDDTAELEVARSSPELADLDADKRGNEFERIHRCGWTRVLPKEWVEEEFSDDDSKDTELTRSVYSQDNGEEEGRRDASHIRWQRQLSKDSDSNTRSDDAGPGRLNDLELLEKDSKPNGTISARHDGTRLEPLRKSARNPFRRKAVPTTRARADRGKGDSREFEACGRSTRVNRVIPAEHDTQGGASWKHNPYQSVEGTAGYVGSINKQDQRGLEHTHYPRHTQEPLIPPPLRIKRQPIATNAEKRPSGKTEENVPRLSPVYHQVTRSSYTSSRDEIAKEALQRPSQVHVHFDASRREAKREAPYYPQPRVSSLVTCAQSSHSSQSSWPPVLLPSDSDGGRRPDQRSSSTRRYVRAATKDGRNLDFDDTRLRASSPECHQLTEPAAAVGSNDARRVIEEFRSDYCQSQPRDVDCPAGSSHGRIEPLKYHHNNHSHGHGAAASLASNNHEAVGGGGDDDKHHLVTDIDDILDMYLPLTHHEHDDRYNHSHQKQQNQNKNQNQILKSDPEPQPKTVRRDKRNEHHQPQLQDIKQDGVLDTSSSRHTGTENIERQALPTAPVRDQCLQTATNAGASAPDPYPLSLRYRPPLALSNNAHARPKRKQVAQNRNDASASDYVSASDTVLEPKTPESEGGRSGAPTRGSSSHCASASASWLSSASSSKVQEIPTPTPTPTPTPALSVSSHGGGKPVSRGRPRNGTMNNGNHNDEGRYSDGTVAYACTLTPSARSASEVATEAGIEPSAEAEHVGRSMAVHMNVPAPVPGTDDAPARKMVPVTVLDRYGRSWI